MRCVSGFEGAQSASFSSVSWTKSDFSPSSRCLLLIIVRKRNNQPEGILVPVGWTLFANSKVNWIPVRNCKTIQCITVCTWKAWFSFGIYLVGFPVTWEAGKSRRKERNWISVACCCYSSLSQAASPLVKAVWLSWGGEAKHPLVQSWEDEIPNGSQVWGDYLYLTMK